LGLIDYEIRTLTRKKMIGLLETLVIEAAQRPLKMAP
jgi:hypothetical protein